MKKTKILSIIAAAILTVGTLASCENATSPTSEAPKTSAVSTQTDTNTQTPTPNPTPEQTTVTAQTSTPEQTPIPTPDDGVTEELLGDEWKASKTEHWQVTVSGKKANIGNHDLVEGECAVCECLVIDNGDYVYVSICDENYNTVFRVEYEGDNDEPECIIETEYKYDGEGNITHHKSTNFGKLYQEGKYSYATYTYEDDFFGQVIPYTYTYCSELTIHNNDGTKTVKNYDENENMVKSTDFDAEGAVTEEATFEYTFFDDGFVKSIKKFVGGKPAFETIYSSFDEGYMIIKQIVYNEDGTTTEFDAINPID